jgi:hypothetical protein
LDGLNFLIIPSIPRNHILSLSQSSKNKSKNQKRNEKGFFMKQVKPTHQPTHQPTVLSSSENRTKLISSFIPCQINTTASTPHTSQIFIYASTTTITATTTSELTSSVSLSASASASIMEDEMRHFARVTKKKDENLKAIILSDNYHYLSASERINFAKSEVPQLFNMILKLSFSPNLRNRIKCNKRKIDEVDSIINHPIIDPLTLSSRRLFNKEVEEDDLGNYSPEHLSLLVEDTWNEVFLEKLSLDSQIKTKELFASNICNIILAERMNGTLATSTTVENGLNLSLNGTSRSGLNFSSQNSSLSLLLLFVA